MKLKTIIISMTALLAGLVPLDRAARADDAGVPLALEESGFLPAEVEGPGASRFRLDVTNNTAAAMEFESFELNRERVVQPGQTVAVYLSGLAPGRYDFFDDFHRERRGTLVIK